METIKLQINGEVREVQMKTPVVDQRDAYLEVLLKTLQNPSSALEYTKHLRKLISELSGLSEEEIGKMSIEDEKNLVKILNKQFQLFGEELGFTKTSASQ